MELDGRGLTHTPFVSLQLASPQEPEWNKIFSRHCSAFILCERSAKALQHHALKLLEPILQCPWPASLRWRAQQCLLDRL